MSDENDSSLARLDALSVLRSMHNGSWPNLDRPLRPIEVTMNASGRKRRITPAGTRKFSISRGQAEGQRVTAPIQVRRRGAGASLGDFQYSVLPEEFIGHLCARSHPWVRHKFRRKRHAQDGE